ncbi:MAG: xanthine dehydrogenase family protein molybdopterin-binding subunit [Deferrisomatales bacterium]|nr:xanthine dehydrogenase family protein molybdopterin-binding subunit [Deferrisomatales bacterium]
MSLRAVGSRAPRRDTLGKVLGTLRFTADLKVPGLLHLAVVRSTEAHARVAEVRTASALAVPGVVRIFTAADVPGENRYGIIRLTADQALLSDRVRMVGDAVALVAAETPEAAALGASRVAVAYEPLPAITSLEEALAAGAAPIHEKGNLCFEQRVERGDVEAAFSRAAAVVERTYRTTWIEHAYLEPEAAVAHRDGNGVLTVTCSTQNPHYDRDDLCRLLGLPAEQVRVIQAPTGGGFGGKLDLSAQLYVALATWHTGRPSRLVYSREESFLASGKRHPFVMRYRSAADAEGNLLAVEADLLADTGAYASYALAVAMRAAVHAAGPYRVPHARIRSRAVYTNHPFSGAMRGFGTPQAAFGHESQMDLLAEALGMDPVALRLRNALRPGDVTVTGQVLEHSVGIVPCLEKVDAVRDRWRRNCRNDRDHLRGIGVGAMLYGIGNTGVSNPSTAQVELGSDGRFTLFTGAADIGQGSDQVLLAVCAEALGTEPARLRLVRGDTGRTTNAGSTSASRQTYISGGAVLDATLRLRDRLLARAGVLLEVPRGDLELADRAVRSRSCPSRGLGLERLAAAFAAAGEAAREAGSFDPDTSALDHRTGQGRPYGTYAFAAQVAQVAVDRATAQVQVERLAAAHDVGRAIHPPGVLGQITGGVAMGLGMALMEEFRPGQDVNLDTYLVPTALDVPRLTPMFVECREPTGPYGAKGVGEPALIPTAPAVANALSRACGARIHSLPATLERVLEALEGREE